MRPAAGYRNTNTRLNTTSDQVRYRYREPRCCCLWTAVVKFLQSEEDSRSTRDLQASSASPPSSGWNKSWHKCCYRICPWKLLEKQEIPLRLQTQSSKSPNSLKSRASKKNTTTSSSSPPHFLPRWRRAARYRPLPDGRTDSADRQTRSSVCLWSLSHLCYNKGVKIHMWLT